MEDSDVLQPGVNIRPQVDSEKVTNILYDIYGLTVVKIKTLNGYDDKNFHVIVDHNQNINKNIDNVCSSGYVLKIINSLDSKKDQFFEGQCELLNYLGKHGITCPKPVLTKEGSYFTKIKLPSGEHIIRLLEFIDGTILQQVPVTPKLLFHVGEFVANLNNAIRSFYHPAYDTYKSLWMLESVPKLTEFLFALSSEDKRKLVSSVIDAFQERVLTVSGTLERGTIHGDFNEQNIILEKRNDDWEIKGVIDFGDSHKACYLFEISITLTYMIIQATDLDAGAYVLAGYLSVRQMPEEERKLIKVCVAARLCQSLVIGAYSNMQDPGNLYVLNTSTRGWELLEEIWNVPDEKLLDRWKTISENMSF